MRQDPDVLRSERRDDVNVVTLIPQELHHPPLVAQVQRQLQELVDGEPGLKLVIVFGNVEAVSSVMLGTLIVLRRSIRHGGGRLKLCGLTERVGHTFRLARIDEVLEIYEDLEQALAAFD